MKVERRYPSAIDRRVDFAPEERTEAMRFGALQAFSLIEPQRALQAAEGFTGETRMSIRRMLGHMPSMWSVSARGQSAPRMPATCVPCPSFGLLLR